MAERERGSRLVGSRKRRNPEGTDMKPSQEVIDELVRRILETVRPLRIILFGSAARGEMGADGDLDVLVVVPDGTHPRRTAQSIYEHMIGFGVSTDVVVATESDLRQHGDNFSLVYYPGLREGREVYAA
jgi:predicted nucleotidyltransferase